MPLFFDMQMLLSLAVTLNYFNLASVKPLLLETPFLSNHANKDQ